MLCGIQATHHANLTLRSSFAGLLIILDKLVYRYSETRTAGKVYTASTATQQTVSSNRCMEPTKQLLNNKSRPSEFMRWWGNFFLRIARRIRRGRQSASSAIAIVNTNCSFPSQAKQEICSEECQSQLTKHIDLIVPPTTVFSSVCRVPDIRCKKTSNVRLSLRL